MSLTFNADSHRYRLDGKPVRGVTGLIGAGIPKPALMWWAAEQAGLWAIEHYPEIPVMGDEAAVRAMRRAHNLVRDAAAVQGTAVHHHAEILARTGEVEAPEEVIPFLTGYAEFLDAWQITPLLMERPVGNRQHWYAGTFDLIATSPLLCDGRPVQIDIKTSKSVHGETKLQTAAYAHAEFYVDEDGVEQPMPEIAGNYVAHVTPDTREGEHARYGDAPLGTSLYVMGEGAEVIAGHFGEFLAAAYIAKTTKARDTVAEPLTIPSFTEQKAA
ncbi:hypothetical protein DWB68_10350 [Galactobacter valiniphilus]|uniref:PD-(D/E)XK endonuclease-like domain-containing protein n=1 Tax=Galactobacter valiniphilus TaxID=2676122 RepID=A0A399J8R3_9MICC|nr:hypothetical protein [Galactobacter valiniphilus]RII41918.1 hypothetical protein DWB68_10350 [Galactobacter valiniphilus]